MHLKFEEFYKISMVCLRVNGAHPAVARDLKWALHFVLMHGYFFIMCSNFVYNIIFVDIKAKDILVACSHGVFVIILIVVSFKYVVLLWYQDNINSLIRTQQHFFDLASELPDSDQLIVYEYAKRGRWVSKLWTVSTLITLFMFPIKGAIDTAYSAFAHGEFELYPFIVTSYPFGIDKIKNRIDVFIIVYIMNMLNGIYSILMYIGFSPLGPIFILNACAQIELVTRQVKLLFNMEILNNEETKRKMKTIILDLEKVYIFVHEINTVFQVLYELCLKASAIMIPVSVYLILEVFRWLRMTIRIDSWSAANQRPQTFIQSIFTTICQSFNRGLLSLDYMMFSYAASLLCFLPCYYGDLLMEKSEELRLALYSNGWQNVYDKRVRQSLLILLIRTTRAISIRSVFRTVCLDTFAELCHQAYAIFNLMNASL